MQSPNEQAAKIREEYLARIGAELQSRLTPLEAYEQLHEMRVHLDSMALAFVELGMEAPEAMRSALGRFGPTGQFGSDYSVP